MPEFRLKRVYDEPAPSDGYRILVDRLWPRGLSKEKLKLDAWDKELAPSSALRKWYHHEVAQWPAFKKKYFEELRDNPAVDALRARIDNGPVTLLYAAKDRDRNNAVALKEFLSGSATR